VLVAGSKPSLQHCHFPVASASWFKQGLNHWVRAEHLPAQTVNLEHHVAKSEFFQISSQIGRRVFCWKVPGSPLGRVWFGWSAMLAAQGLDGASGISGGSCSLAQVAACGVMAEDESNSSSSSLGLGLIV